MILPIGPGGYESRWRCGKSSFKELLNDGRIAWKNEETPQGIIWKIYQKFYLEGRKKQPSDLWRNLEGNKKGSLESKEILGGKYFDSPKPTDLIRHCLLIASCKDDIILDFFSGSATTAHAVMKLNAEDGGTRRHIQVQLPEPCDEKSAAFKAGYATIAEIGKERIRRAGKKILEDWQAKNVASESEPDLIPNSQFSTPNSQNSKPSPPDVGFRVLKVDSSNMTADYYKRPDETTQDALALAVENIKPDRQPEDLLFQVMLDWGVELSLEIRKVELGIRNAFGKEITVFLVAENALLACFDRGITDEASQAMAKMQPLRAVFRDASFKDDAARINVEQLFKTLSPTTEVRAI